MAIVLTFDMSSLRVAIAPGDNGIGVATARLFLQAGACVAICGRDDRRLLAAQQALQAFGPAERLLAYRCESLDPAQVTGFARASGVAFGGVDVLIANTGESRAATFLASSADLWSDELDRKFFSIIRPVRAFLPLLERSPVASVVCVNSLLAHQPEPAFAVTSAARAGVQSLVKSMAIEFAPKNVRVNAVLVGIQQQACVVERAGGHDAQGPAGARRMSALAQRKGVPLGRAGAAGEVAMAIFHLGSPLLSYTTGSHIDVAGGLARRA